MSKILLEKLYADLVRGIKNEFALFNITIEEKDDDIIVSYMNWKRRFISKKNRKVIYSKDLLNNPKYKIYKRSIDKIAHKFKIGADLTPFLSKGIVDNPYEKNSRKDKDIFLNAFGIHHLHLLNSYESKEKSGINFIKRHNDLLYVFIKENKVYFLDVDIHNFGNMNLFRIIKNNWEDLISPYELKGIDSSGENLTDEMIYNITKKGASVGIEIDKKIYALCSLTVSGHTGNWMFDFNQIRYKLEDLSFKLSFDTNLLKKEINLMYKKFIDELEFSIIVKDGYAYLVEIKSGSTIVINEQKNKWEIYEGNCLKERYLLDFNY